MTALPHVALAIAGSDSGGGAGIHADLATFRAFGVHGASAITAVTAQNTRGVSGIHAVPPEFVAEQIRTVCRDLPVAAAKTGMLAGPATVDAVAGALEECGVSSLVVDPVRVSTTGTPLLAHEARETLLRRLIPQALVVTPNLAEAEWLVDAPVRTVDEMRAAAQALHARGPGWVLIKGGHLPGRALDVLFGGSGFTDFEVDRIDTPHLHGTGCVLSAALAALLARGVPVPEAVAGAKAHVTGAIRHAVGLGRGAGWVNPAWNLRPEAT
ncbi:MAG TPA: bifunctional hydroxymethylpyrimidine kinase/phosphomethylpyrimidine kinase [Actinomycetota bacterium]|nr:bifunctional hydroxymethylpyrimidine kinase/phosphomethylpyrimidine kinase [Actinomycetota bacterium]